MHTIDYPLTLEQPQTFWHFTHCKHCNATIMVTGRRADGELVEPDVYPCKCKEKD